MAIMTIKPGSKMAGIPTIKVRDSFLRHKNSFISLVVLQMELGIPAEVAAQIIEEACSNGWLKKTENAEYEITDEGSRFCLANATRGISRAKAERMVEDLLNRADSVNANVKLAFTVDRIDVFGSFLDPQASLLGDVDLVFSLRPRCGERRAQEAIQVERRRNATRRLSSIFEQVRWPSEEIRLLLKAGKVGLNLHEWDERLELNTKFRTIYPRRVADYVDTISALWVLTLCRSVTNLKPYCIPGSDKHPRHFVAGMESLPVVFSIFGILSAEQLAQHFDDPIEVRPTQIHEVEGVVETLTPTHLHRHTGAMAMLQGRLGDDLKILQQRLTPMMPGSGDLRNGFTK